MDTNRESGSRASSDSESRVPLDVLPLHSTNLLTVLDEDGVIQYESPSIERIYGYQQDDLVGEQVAECAHPDDRERLIDSFQALLTSEAGTVEAVEYRHEQADGTYTWVESVASANPTPAGHYVVNTRDVSAQKQRERRLQDANERLDEFASIVSHDLRNPLNIAQGRLQMAREDCDSDHLDDVANAHDRMAALVESLLSLSRAGKRVAETEPVGLAALCESCWQAVPTADATLVVETDRRLRADRQRLQQLLENLVRNAIEHAGADVSVRVGAMETGFYVEDDGPGIPPDERSRVFEAGHSTTREGTGLGLSIVKQVIDAHEWQIHLADGARGGARFEITGVEFVE
jgi:PAS domain S-box-containing protein